MHSGSPINSGSSRGRWETPPPRFVTLGPEYMGGPPSGEAVVPGAPLHGCVAPAGTRVWLVFLGKRHCSLRRCLRSREEAFSGWGAWMSRRPAGAGRGSCLRPPWGHAGRGRAAAGAERRRDCARCRRWRAQRKNLISQRAKGRLGPARGLLTFGRKSPWEEFYSQRCHVLRAGKTAFSSPVFLSEALLQGASCVQAEERLARPRAGSVLPVSRPPGSPRGPISAPAAFGGLRCWASGASTGGGARGAEGGREAAGEGSKPQPRR